MAQPQYGSQQWPGHAARPASGGSKGLPIAIGAGLAVGVFAGLIVVRGTGAEAGEATTESADAGATVVATTPDAAALVATTPDAAAVSVDAAPEKPAAPVLTFEVEPADAEGLEITVDGEKVEGSTYAVTLGEGDKPRKVKIRASASGYRAFSKRLTVAADDTLKITLKKRGRGGTTSTSPGGLIDL